VPTKCMYQTRYINPVPDPLPTERVLQPQIHLAVGLPIGAKMEWYYAMGMVQVLRRTKPQVREPAERGGDVDIRRAMNFYQVAP